MIRPVTEKNASEEVKRNYQLLREAFKLNTLPSFFTFIGAFPEYLTFITEQIVRSADNREFQTLSKEIGDEISWKINHTFSPSSEVIEWISRNNFSPSFYNFQKDTQYIYVGNVKLAIIFIALREAVKGWAVAAKKLPDTIPAQPKTETAENKEFFDEFMKEIVTTEKTLQHSDKEIVQNLLPQFLRLCQADFDEVMRTEKFLQIRIEAEEQILNNLTHLPDLIFSPVNIVITYTSKYPDFPDLLYLLSEHFPTYAMQRVLFSAYLLKDR